MVTRAVSVQRWRPPRGSTTHTEVTTRWLRPGQSPQHPYRLVGVGGLAQRHAVEHHGGVRGEDHGPGAVTGHPVGLGPRHPGHVVGPGPPREDGLVHVRGDDVERQVRPAPGARTGGGTPRPGPAAGPVQGWGGRSSAGHQRLLGRVQVARPRRGRPTSRRGGPPCAGRGEWLRTMPGRLRGRVGVGIESVEQVVELGPTCPTRPALRRTSEPTGYPFRYQARCLRKGTHRPRPRPAGPVVQPRGSGRRGGGWWSTTSPSRGAGGAGSPAKAASRSRNSQGRPRQPRPMTTPSQPVADIMASASSGVNTSPLPSTGIVVTAALSSPMRLPVRRWARSAAARCGRAAPPRPPPRPPRCGRCPGRSGGRRRCPCGTSPSPAPIPPDSASAAASTTAPITRASSRRL